MRAKNVEKLAGGPKSSESSVELWLLALVPRGEIVAEPYPRSWAVRAENGEMISYDIYFKRMKERSVYCVACVLNPEMVRTVVQLAMVKAGIKTPSITSGEKEKTKFYAPATSQDACF